MPKTPGQAAIRLLRDGGGCVEFSRFVAALVPSCHWELQCRRAGNTCRRVVCVSVVYSFSIIGDSCINLYVPKNGSLILVKKVMLHSNQNLPSALVHFQFHRFQQHELPSPMGRQSRDSQPLRGRDLLSAKLLRSSFDRLDENGDGFVSRAELQRLLERAGSKLAQAQLLG